MVAFEEQVQPASSPDAPTALFLPGAGYTAQAPLLHWTARALREVGWRIVRAEWQRRPSDVEDARKLVREALEDFAGSGPDLVVAKSIGTLALPWAVKKGVAGIWLTPLLFEIDVAAALACADERHLAIGGTDDPAWIPAAVAGTDAIVHTVAGADHGLEVASSWRDSALGQLPAIDLAVEHAQRTRLR